MKPYRKISSMGIGPGGRKCPCCCQSPKIRKPIDRANERRYLLKELRKLIQEIQDELPD